MKNCSEYRELINAYFDDELENADALRVEGHLKTCESCFAAFGFYLEISAALEESLVDAPPALRERVMDQIRSGNVTHIDRYAKRRKATRFALTRLVPVAACLAVILLVLPLVINLNRSYIDNADMELYYSGSRDGSLSEETAAKAPSPSGSAMSLTEAERDEGAVATEQPGLAAGGSGWPEPAPAPPDSVARFPDEHSSPEATPEPEAADNEGGDPSNAPMLAGDVQTGDGLMDAPYYVVIEISGELPASLADYVALFIDDLTLHYFIPRDAVQGLIDELAGRPDVTISAMDLTGEQALVVYTRESR